MIILIKIVGFILLVNFLPFITGVILEERCNRPIDGNLRWFDGRPLLGAHKTIRGLLAGVLGGLVISLPLQLPWLIGGGAALLAMIGDLITSFIKRRLRYASGKAVPVLDQFLESLLPILFFHHFLQLSLWQLAAILLSFIFLAHLGSLFWHYILYRSSPKNSPRIIRSPVRWREWRACHQPLARWHYLFNLTSVLSYLVFLTGVFRIIGIYEYGKSNSLAIEKQTLTLPFHDLPENFDQFRLLFLTDLHLDGLEELTDTLIDQIRDIECDLCLIGGDIRMKTYGPMAPCLRQLRRLLPHIRSRHGLLAVLGNHDCIEMTPEFEDVGMVMLINDAQEITVANESIWIVGLDDPHYYKVDDADKAVHGIPEGSFKIFLAHSPEAYKKAAHCHARLYLCGHTHGGQICLPGRKPIVTNSRAPRFTASGLWQYHTMTGYTSRGVGASGIPLRFNCPGEISLITLRRSAQDS